MLSETTIDVDDDILTMAQVNVSLVESGEFVERFRSKQEASSAIRDLIAGADSVVELRQLDVAYGFLAAAVKAIEQCFNAQIEIAPALHSQALKRLVVAAKTAFGAESGEAVKAERLLSSFGTRLASVAAEAPATVQQASVLSPLGLRCWSQGCKQPSNATNLMNCARCKVALYCSRDCQTADWTSGHKTQCKSFVEARAKAGSKNQ
jgi:hypothetical protein